MATHIYLNKLWWFHSDRQLNSTATTFLLPFLKVRGADDSDETKVLKGLDKGREIGLTNYYHIVWY